MDFSPTDFAEAAIRAYLDRCPHGADTLCGVHEWWVAWPRPAHICFTAAALERLQSHGVVECVPAGGGELWRRCRPAPAAGT